MGKTQPPNSRRPLRFDLAWLGALGMLGLLGFIPGLEPLRLLLLLSLLSLLSLLAPLLRRRSAQDRTALQPEPQQEPQPQPQPPLNGPAQRGGIAVFMVKVYASYALAFLNPIQLAQMLLQGFGQLVALVRTRGAPPDATYVQKARYTLPFREAWFVYNGGVTPETSHSWDIIAQRYAYDFVIADASLMRHRGSGHALEDYFCYSREVLSPADGEVVSVRDGVRDAPRPGSGWLDFLALDFRGNHVVIKHAEGEYSFLAHLIPGSIRVRKGDRVQRGDVIGLCGNSGHSTEPHLHFHVQDHASFWIAAGVPVKFDGVAIAGAPQPPTHLVRGAHISPHEYETITTSTAFTS